MAVEVNMNSGIMKFNPSEAAKMDAEPDVNEAKNVQVAEPVVAEKKANKKKIGAGGIVAISTLGASTLGALTYGIITHRKLNNSNKALKSVNQKLSKALQDKQNLTNSLNAANAKNSALKTSLDDLESRNFFQRWKSNKKHA